MQPSFPAGFPGGMPGFPAGAMPHLDPGLMREMMGMLRKNPGMMQSMLSAVTPEQLQAAVRASWSCRTSLLPHALCLLAKVAVWDVLHAVVVLL